jgi:hypothetical protein
MRSFQKTKTTATTLAPILALGFGVGAGNQWILQWIFAAAAAVTNTSNGDSESSFNGVAASMPFFSLFSG